MIKFGKYFVMAGAVAVWGSSAALALDEEETPSMPQAGMEAEPMAQAAEADSMDEMMELREKLQELSSTLQAIQIEAMEAKEVVEALEVYEAAVKEKMLSLAPDKESQMDESSAIMKELRDVRDPEALSEEEMEKLEVKFARYQELAEELMDVEMEAQQDEGVTTARESVEEKMLAAMNAENAEAGAMMEEFEQMAARFQELQEAMFMQQMQMMQQEQGEPALPQDTNE